MFQSFMNAYLRMTSVFNHLRITLVSKIFKQTVYGDNNDMN